MRKCILVVALLVSALAAFAETVYITATGSKYHREGCRYLAASSFPVELDDAIGRGYDPCSACFPSSSDKPAARELTGRVVGVTDGDTLVLLVGYTQHRIRLNGIDAPETGQAWGSRAKRALSELCFGREVRVVVTGVDRYARELGDVHVDGLFVNAELVRQGMAWHYKEYSRDPALAELELQARADGRGLWVDPAPVPPWEYRKGQRPLSDD